MSANRKRPSLEEIWKVIESFGIKREVFEKWHPTEEDLLDLYHFIKKTRHDQKDKETVRRLRKYLEKWKKRKK